LIEVFEDGDRSKSLFPEKELCRQVALTHFKQNPTAAFLTQLSGQFFQHLSANAKASVRTGDGKIKHMQFGTVQFVNHKRDDRISYLRDHSNTVALPQATRKVFVGPRKFKCLLLDPKDFCHIPTDHPTDVNLQ